MKRILIANRGEIAIRIAQSCREMGIAPIAIYSEADRGSLHVTRSVEAYYLSGSTLTDTYLNIQQIVDIAVRARVDAIHPGYGLLSENAEFAEAVIATGITWIGPPPAVIATLGDKMQAREVALTAGAPVVPGTTDPLQTAAEVHVFAEQHGLPVAVKAAHGGGGRGMRVIWREEEIERSFASAAQEALIAFGRSECYVEKYIARPRHIEVQILADTHGHVIALDTRDCSMQRRFQKLLEESPAPFLDPDIRARAIEAARSIAQVAGYVGVGTVEFLLSRDGELSFLEVNTRLQVEHSVTEEAVGVDMVRAQIDVARGLKLPFQSDIVATRHAIEFRITCEDPGRGFLPAPGRVDEFEPAFGPGVRTDTAVLSGHDVRAEFDSLIAKVIVSAPTRSEAIAKSRRVLDEMSLSGLPTVLGFHRRLLDEPAFAGDGGLGIHTRWIEEDLDWEMMPSDQFTRPSAARDELRTVDIIVDGLRVELGLPSSLLSGGLGDVRDFVDGGRHTTTNPHPEESAVAADLSGAVMKVLVAEGQEVSAGETIFVLESMKMEYPVAATVAGVVTEVLVHEGHQVQAGEPLMHFEP